MACFLLSTNKRLWVSSIISTINTGISIRVRVHYMCSIYPAGHWFQNIHMYSLYNIFDSFFSWHSAKHLVTEANLYSTRKIQKQTSDKGVVCIYGFIQCVFVRFWITYFLSSYLLIIFYFTIVTCRIEESWIHLLSGLNDKKHVTF